MFYMLCVERINSYNIFSRVNVYTKIFFTKTILKNLASSKLSTINYPTFWHGVQSRMTTSPCSSSCACQAASQPEQPTTPLILCVSAAPATVPPPSSCPPLCVPSTCVWLLDRYCAFRWRVGSSMTMMVMVRFCFLFSCICFFFFLFVFSSVLFFVFFFFRFAFPSFLAFFFLVFVFSSLFSLLSSSFCFLISLILFGHRT